MVEVNSPIIKITSVEQLIERGLVPRNFTKDALAQHASDCFGDDIKPYIRAHFPANRESITLEEAYQMIRSYHIVGSAPISVEPIRFNSHPPRYTPSDSRRF